MLKKLSEHCGSNQSDIIRRLIVEGFRSEFGETITCYDCCETHVVKNPSEAGWMSMVGPDESFHWLCPKCSNGRKK